MLLGWLKTNNKRYFSVLLVASFSVLATQDSDQIPDMALLEYLAELVEVDGELIGPLDMEAQKDTSNPTDIQDNETQQPTGNGNTQKPSPKRINQPTQEQ